MLKALVSTHGNTSDNDGRVFVWTGLDVPVPGGVLTTPGGSEGIRYSGIPVCSCTGVVPVGRAGVSALSQAVPPAHKHGSA